MIGFHEPCYDRHACVFDEDCSRQAYPLVTSHRALETLVGGVVHDLEEQVGEILAERVLPHVAQRLDEELPVGSEEVEERLERAPAAREHLVVDDHELRIAVPVEQVVLVGEVVVERLARYARPFRDLDDRDLVERLLIHELAQRLREPELRLVCHVATPLTPKKSNEVILLLIEQSCRAQQGNAMQMANASVMMSSARTRGFMRGLRAARLLRFMTRQKSMACFTTGRYASTNR